MSERRTLVGWRQALVGQAPQAFSPAIQGLRGFAAATVVLVHIYAMPRIAGLVPPGFPDWLDRVVVTGGRGVELFFMISGYLIPASLVRHGRTSKFFFDRAMRIMPVFVVLHLALFVAGPLVGYKIFVGMSADRYAFTFLGNLVFLPDLFGVPIGQQNAWTLTYEWLFYIWFAAFYLLAVEKSSRLGAALFGLLAIAAVIVWPRSSFFAVGVLLAMYRFRLVVPGAAGLVAGLALVVVLYGTCEYVHPFVGLLPGALLFAMVLSPGSGFARWLATRPLLYAGQVSYSLYLVHPFVLFVLLAIASRFIARGWDAWLVLAAFAIIGVAASLAAATISFWTIEVWLRRRIEALLLGRQAPARARLPEHPLPAPRP